LRSAAPSRLGVWRSRSGGCVVVSRWVGFMHGAPERWFQREAARTRGKRRCSGRVGGVISVRGAMTGPSLTTRVLRRGCGHPDPSRSVCSYVHPIGRAFRLAARRGTRVA
jgi:hypothetical protein